MRIRHLASVSLMALALVACNDTLDSAATVDLASVKNKVEHPLSDRIVAQMAKKGMNRNSPIMIRILKEEGMMEIWKAKTDNRFDKIAEYKICAWSGRLGPKVKEGDRQAPEGFYELSPANLNPNSNYYLAINTGFPNRYDQENGRSGANLMIHGACSSSGCYSMTDEEVLKPGYDNFEVTKRPPEVAFCEKKYVFNQQAESGAGFNPSGACPTMSTPPALAAALGSYDKKYQADYAQAMKKYDGVAWYDPTEAERKAIVAKERKGHDIAYAPTG